MSKRFSDEEAAQKMKDANFLPLESYPGAGKAWKCKCLACGNTVSPRLSTVQMGVGCAHCAGLAKISQEEAHEIFSHANLEPIGTYKNSKSPWRSICKICKNEVSPSVYYVKANGTGCKYCSYKALGIARRISEADALALLATKGHIALEPYPGSSIPWRTIHEPCGRECTPRLAGIRDGEGGCGFCAGKIRDDESAIEIMKSAGFEPLEPYKSSKSFWRCRHLLCGNEVKTKFNTVQQGKGGCSFCSPTAKIAQEEAIQFFLAHGLKPLVPYESSTTPWLSIHLACGNKVSPPWSSIQQGGGGCMYCAGNAPILEDAAKDLFFSKELFPISEYVNASTPWLSIHQPCGKKVSPTVATLRSGGGGCSYCGGALIDAEDAIELMLSNGYEPLVAYPGADTKWKSIHQACGNEVAPRLTNVKRGEAGCLHCSGKVPVTEDDARELFLSKGFIPQEVFRGTHYPWLAIHKNCGKTISPRYKAVRSGLAGCKYCSGNKVDEEDAILLFLSKGLKPIEPFTYTNNPWKSIHLECNREVSPRYADVAHNNGGCKFCATKGFDLTTPADLYLITNALLGAHKVGISGATTRRLQVHKKEGWDVWRTHRFDSGDLAYEVEQEVLSWFREELGLPAYLSSEDMPQGGWTETVEADEIELNEIWRKVELLVKFKVEKD